MKKLLIVVLMLMFAFSLAYTKDEREMTEIMKAKKQQIEKLKVERKSALKEDTKIEQKGFEIAKSDTRIKLDSPITYSSGKHKFNPVVDQTEGMHTVKEGFEGSLPNANWLNYSMVGTMTITGMSHHVNQLTVENPPGVRNHQIGRRILSPI